MVAVKHGLQVDGFLGAMLAQLTTLEGEMPEVVCCQYKTQQRRPECLQHGHQQSANEMGCSAAEGGNKIAIF